MSHGNHGHISKPGASFVGREPVLFSEAHLQELVREIREDKKYPMMPTIYNRDLAFDQLVMNLRKQAVGKFYLSPDAFEYVKKIFVEKYYSAQIKAGFPVMIITTEAYIAAVMQATLNTFHKSGAANDTGFSAIYEILHVPPGRKKKQVYLHFNKIMKRNEIFLKRSELVYKTIDSFILDTEIEEFQDLKKYWWHPVQMAAQNITIAPETLVMRIHLNLTDLVAYRVSLQDIVRALLDEKPAMVNFLFGSIKDAVMDIVIDYNLVFSEITAARDVKEDTNYLQVHYRYFYNRYLYPVFESLRVSGIPGVEHLYLGEANVFSAFRKINKLGGELLNKILSHPIMTKYDSDLKSSMNSKELSYFFITKKRDVTLYSGVSDECIQRLIEAYSGKMIKIEDLENNAILSPGLTDANFLMILPGNISAKDSLSPDRIVTGTIPPDEKLPPNAIHDVDGTISNHYYAVLDSVSLEKVLELPDCDYRYTYCNNFHVMARVFGIEMARMYHLYNSMEIIESLDTTASPGYISAFSDVVTQRGRFLGINSTGIARQAGGFMYRSTISEPNKILPTAALFDKQGESIHGSSAALTVGQTPKIGTGLTSYGVKFDLEPEKVSAEDFGKILLSLEGEKKQIFSIDVLYDTATSAEEAHEATSMFQEGVTRGKINKVRHDEKRKIDPQALLDFKGEPSMATIQMIDAIAVPITATGLPRAIGVLMDKYRPRPVPEFFRDNFDPDIVPRIPDFNITLKKSEYIDLEFLLSIILQMN